LEDERDNVAVDEDPIYISRREARQAWGEFINGESEGHVYCGTEIDRGGCHENYS